jgi:N-acetylneuraminate synthase
VAKNIQIDGRAIGSNEPCYVIAEGCDNHLGNMAVAKEMIRQAKACGVDAIKFQHHLPDEEMLRDQFPTSGNFNIPLYEFLQRYALTLEQHYELFAFAKALGITYLCTPFSLKAARELNEMGLPAFKIGSGELTDLPTLKAIAAFGKPMILSTGMAEWKEIDETIAALRPINDQIVLMNCVSEYPAKHSDVNLNVIGEISRRYNVTVGHSDNTPDIYTSIAAVAVGAKLLEKHFILDRRQPGPDQSVSVEAYEFYELVTAVRRVEQALGSDKKVHDLEKPIRAWAHRSVVSLRAIPKGSQITAEMIWTKRPGTGIPAKHLEEIVSRTAACDIPANHLIRWEELA